MKRWCWMVAALLFGTSPLAAAPDGRTELVDVLNKATAAARKLTALSYEATLFGEGAMAESYGQTSGRVTAIRGSSEATHKIAIQASTLIPGTSQPATYNFATDGVDSFQVDSTTKVFTFGRPSEFRMSFSNPLFPPRYLQDAPFKDILENPDARYEGLKAVDGKECHVVMVPPPNIQTPTLRLYLGKEDYLLRRMEMSRPMAQRPGLPPATGSIVLAVRNLDTQPKVEDAMFRLECPEGYQKKPLTIPQNPAQAGMLSVGSEAPDWQLKSSDGKTVTLKGLRGKVVLLDFWATWCGPCKMAMPSIQKLHDRFKDKPVAIYGVNCWERDPKLDPMDYIKQQKFTYGQLLQGDQAAMAYRVGGIPSLYLIGPDGKILWTASGFNPSMEEAMAQMIEKAIVK